MRRRARSSLPKFEKYANRSNPERVEGKSQTRRQIGDMNGLENKYAHWLEGERLAGRIHAWKFEPLGLRLAERCTYNPDFLVIYPDGRTEIHEVKGHWEDDALVKIKVAAESFPWWYFKAVQLRGGQWQVREFNPR